MEKKKTVDIWTKIIQQEKSETFLQNMNSMRVKSKV